MTTIMIVDDHPLVRDGMSAMLENESDFSIVASVANGEAAVEHCRRAGLGIARIPRHSSGETSP